MAQLDLSAEAARTPALPRLTAALSFVLAVLTAAGSAAAMAFMWGPYL